MRGDETLIHFGTTAVKQQDRSIWRRVVAGATSVALVATVAIFAGYAAAKHTPTRFVVSAPPPRAEAIVASTAMVDRAASLVSQAQSEGEWSASFTQDEINSWLAVEAPDKHKELFPTGVAEIRLSLEDGGVWAACRYEGGLLASGVYSVELHPSMVEPNLLAVRLDGAWAGAAPLPLGRMRERVAEALTAAGLDVSWSRSEGCPLLLIRLPEDAAWGDRTLELHAVAIVDERLELAGLTRPVEKSAETTPHDAPTSSSDGDARQENDHVEESKSVDSISRGG